MRMNTKQFFFTIFSSVFKQIEAKEINQHCTDCADKKRKNLLVCKFKKLHYNSHFT